MAVTIDRLFVEIGASAKGLTDELARATKAIHEAGFRMNRSGQRIVATFHDALNPTAALNRELQLLAKSGYNAGEIVRVMGDRIMGATQTARAHGQQIPDLVRKYESMARSVQNAKTPMESLMGVFSSFKGILGQLGLAFGAFQLASFIRDSVNASKQLESAFLGLSSVAANLGVSTRAARDASISLSKDGFMNLADSSKGLQNLLASGLSLPFATELMNKNKDAAIFNRQAHLGLSESIRVFTQGFKDEISTLTDATGVSTNYSRALKETFNLIKSGQLDFSKYRNVLSETEIAQIKQTVATAKSTDALDKHSKSIIAGIGFLKELELFEGNAARGADLLAVKQQKLENSMLLVKAAVGDALIPALTALLEVFGNLIEGVQGGSTGFGILAKAIALPIQGILKLGEYFAGFIEKLGAMNAKFFMMQLAFAEATKAFNPLALVIIPALQKGLSASTELIVEGQKQLVNFGKAGQNLQATLDKFGKVTLSDVAEKQRKVNEGFVQGSESAGKLQKAVEDSVHPFDALVRKMDESVKAGANLNHLLLINAKALAAAADEQSGYGKTISDANVKILEEAVRLKVLADRADDARKAVKILDAETIDLSKHFADARKESEKLIEKFEEMAYYAPVRAAQQLNRELDDLIIGTDETKKRMESLPVVFGQVEKAAKSMGDEMMRQVSTIFTDLSKGIADAIVEWKGFWETLESIGKEFAKSIIRIFVEQLFRPLKSDLEDIAKKFGDWLGGLLGFGGGGVSSGGVLGKAGRGAGAVLGGVVGAAGGLAGGLIGGGISAIGSIIGGFISGSLVRRDTKETEVNTRYTWRYIAALLDETQGGVVPVLWEIRAFLGHTITPILEDIREILRSGIPILGTVQVQGAAAEPSQSAAEPGTPQTGGPSRDIRSRPPLPGFGVSTRTEGEGTSPARITSLGQSISNLAGQISRIAPVLQQANRGIRGMIATLDDMIQTDVPFIPPVAPPDQGRVTVNAPINLTLDFTVTSRSEDLVRTVKNEVIPILKREMVAGTTGLRESIRWSYDRTAKAY